MGDVEIFYAELSSASGTVSTAVGDLILGAGDLTGDDTGIDNPASRPLLRLEMHRHLSALCSAVRARTEAASALAASTQRIADRYTDLDVELTGRNA